MKAAFFDTKRRFSGRTGWKNAERIDEAIMVESAAHRCGKSRQKIVHTVDAKCVSNDYL